MPDRVHRNPNLIFSVGTQVVALSEVRADLEFHEREYERLRAELQKAFDESKWPETPTGAAALHDLLVRLRLKEHVAGTSGSRA